MCRRLSIGVAKFRFCPSVIWRVAMPITLPERSNTGPPEEPGEIGALIWIRRWPSSSRIALTSPSLTVFESPLGLEMVAMRSPTLSPEVAPRVRAWSPDGRSRRGGAGAACEAPQRGQRRAGAMIAAPQWGQISNPVMRGRVPQPGSRTFKYLVPRPPAQPRLDDVNEV